MIRPWLDAARRAPLALQLLLILAFARYLSQGLYGGLFANGFDFKVIHDAAVAVVHGNGAGIYDAFLAFRPGDSSLFYMYPPPAAFLFAPIGVMSFPAAFVVFQLLSHAAVFAFWALSTKGWPTEKRLAALVAVLLFYPLYMSLRLGQSEPIILLCLAGAFNLKKPAAAGLFLAVAIWLKLFLALLLLHLLLRGRHRALAWTVLWLAVLFAAGFLAVPWSAQAAYWPRLLAPLGIEAFYDNQSASGFAHRLLTASPYVTGWFDAPRGASLLKAALALLFVGGYARAALRSKNEGRVLALCLVTALLAAPHADTHHQALLLAGFLSLPLTFGTAAFYAAFAEFVPVVADKFISLTRLQAVAHGPLSLVLSLPFFVLAAFWFYLYKDSEEPTWTS